MGVHFPARVDEAVVVGPAIPDEVPIIVRGVVDAAGAELEVAIHGVQVPERLLFDLLPVLVGLGAEGVVVGLILAPKVKLAALGVVIVGV